MSDTPKEAEKAMEKEIFISGDGWLAVFDLLAPSQLGLGIAMISHRFDFFVDKHFKARKWALKFVGIRSKIGGNGTKEMKIVNEQIGTNDGKPMPIPLIQLPRKVIGFERIDISFIDRNAITFLHRFRQLFASRPINLLINTHNDRIAEFLLRNIWPMFGKNIAVFGLSDTIFRRLRQLVPSILNDLPLLRVVDLWTVNLCTFNEFPADDNANASDGQALIKWLFTPRPDNVPKVLKCPLDLDGWILESKLEVFKAVFAYASSPVNFIVRIWLRLPFADSVLAFDLTNELTREQLELKRIDAEFFLLVRCPIVRDESKWTQWEEEASDWRFIEPSNQISIQIIREEEIGNGLLDAMIGPSDQQQQK
ncbi:hypothetical protein niasHT_030994 [Heterodera trifolii]|uniref:F-box domain-containing protein n=1 Tax=Heterodera trifolii TaxID=157864 RepID=A0ABD2HQJ3_9BILA